MYGALELAVLLLHLTRDRGGFSGGGSLYCDPCDSRGAPAAPLSPSTGLLAPGALTNRNKVVNKALTLVWFSDNMPA